MSKKERNPGQPIDKFMASRLQESRKREAEYEATLDPRQRGERNDS